MSYCKRLDIADVDKFSEKQLNDYLDMCEDNCPRYTTCDTVAHMNDRLKEIQDISRVVPLWVDVDDWDKYLGMAKYDYRDIWVDEADLDDDYVVLKLNELLDLNDEYKEAKQYLLDKKVDYIVLRADIN